MVESPNVIQIVLGFMRNIGIKGVRKKGNRQYRSPCAMDFLISRLEESTR